MSLQLIVPGAAFTKSVAKLGMPHLDIAQDYFLFGGSVAASIANQKSGGAAGVAVGSPVVTNAGYMSVNGDVNFIKSGTNSTGPCTFLSVWRNNAGGNYPNVGNYDIVGSTGLGLMTSSGTSWSAFLNGTPVVSTNDPLDTTHFKLAAITYDGARVNIYVYSTGGLLTATNTATGAIAAAACHWGGQHNYGTHDAALGMVFASALTATQINDIYTYAKAFLASRGVTVL